MERGGLFSPFPCREGAGGFEEERMVVLSAGCDDYLRKPFREEDIFNLMHKHIGMRFVYEEGTQVTESQSRREPIAAEDLKSEIAALPSELVASLEEATECCEMEVIGRVIAEIRDHNASLSDMLTRLASNFAYDEILTLIQAKKNDEE